MCTSIRPKISEKNKYWISKHRYYELKHFCLQYPMWKKLYSVIDDLSLPAVVLNHMPSGNTIGDPTAKKATIKAYYANQIKMVEDAAKDTDKDLQSYILRAVTEGLSYEYLHTKLNIPCCRDTYYDRYRRFFWLLNTRK